MQNYYFEIGFLVLAAILVPALGYYVHQDSKRRNKEAMKSMQEKGYVVDEAYVKPIGTVTRIWGRFPAPIPLYVQVSNFDAVSIAAGNMGIADIRIGYPEFDANFVIRSNDPASCKIILDPEICKRISEYENIRFRTGSLDSLVSVDYFTDQKTGRDLRNMWMIESSGKLTAQEQQALLQLAKEICAKIEKICQNWRGSQNLEVSFLEGR